MIKKFFHPSLLLLFLDPGSDIRDPGWEKIRIRNTASNNRHFRVFPNNSVLTPRKLPLHLTQISKYFSFNTLSIVHSKVGQNQPIQIHKTGSIVEQIFFIKKLCNNSA
jgi:hypothetical protein